MGLLASSSAVAMKGESEFGLFSQPMEVAGDDEKSGVVNLEFVEERGFVEVRVMTRDVMEALLGVAFHLRYAENLEYLDYQSGDVLESEGDEPVYLVRDDLSNRQLVVGMSLKRGDVLPVVDGELISFRFRRVGDGELSFSFENPVISTLIDDLRVDLKEVRWLINGERGIESDSFQVKKNVDEWEGWMLTFAVLLGLLVVLSGYLIYSLRE